MELEICLKNEAFIGASYFMGAWGRRGGGGGWCFGVMRELSAEDRMVWLDLEWVGDIVVMLTTNMVVKVIVMSFVRCRWHHWWWRLFDCGLLWLRLLQWQWGL